MGRRCSPAWLHQASRSSQPAHHHRNHETRVRTGSPRTWGITLADAREVLKCLPSTCATFRQLHLLQRPWHQLVCEQGGGQLVPGSWQLLSQVSLFLFDELPGADSSSWSGLGFAASAEQLRGEPALGERCAPDYESHGTGSRADWGYPV